MPISLPHGLEFYGESDRSQYFLELRLLFIAAISCVGKRTNHFTLMCYFGPEFIVIKIALVSLPTRVVDILHVNENTNFLNERAAISVNRSEAIQGPFNSRLSHFVCSLSRL